MHLFTVVWILSFFYSLITIFPLIILKYYLFFRSSWLNYQNKLYNFLLGVFYIFYISLLFFCHLNLIPIILNFFLNWELTDKSYLLRIETEISFYYYLSWLVLFKNNLSLIITYICLLLLLSYMHVKLLILYYYFLHYKKLLGFIIIVFIYLCIPPDFLIQFVLIYLIYIIIELLFFIFCILFYQYLKIIRCLQ